MPEGYYAIEVLLPVGRLVVNEEKPPPAESGRRGPKPGFVNRQAFTEDPEA